MQEQGAGGCAPRLHEHGEQTHEQTAARAATVDAAALAARCGLAAQVGQREEELRGSKVRDHVQPR